MNQRRPLVDPFYDQPMAGRQAALAPEAPLQTSEAVRGTTTAGVSNLVGYRDAGEMVLGNGRGMGAALPGSFLNSGTVIPHAGLGGVPNGVRIHDTQSLQVNVDPHLERTRATVNLRDIPRYLAMAQELAAQTTPEPSNVGSIRERAATTFQEIANLARQDQNQQAQPGLQQMPAIRQSPQQQFAQQPQLQQPQQLQQQPTRQVRPLQMFVQSQSPPPEQFLPRVVDTQVTTTPERGGVAPRCEVTFEIEQFGEMTALYHDVVLQPGLVILVYDRTYQGRMYQPPHGQQAPPMALAIAGHSSVYLVHATGIHYAYGNYEFCVLLVDREAPLQS